MSNAQADQQKTAITTGTTVAKRKNLLRILRSIIRAPRGDKVYQAVQRKNARDKLAC